MHRILTIGKKRGKVINDKYQLNYDYRRFSCSKLTDAFNIHAKINGAFIVIGLLYGKGDLDKTIEISCRCGQDSDCNPSNAGGIIATTIGFSKIPDCYKSAMDLEQTYGAYSKENQGDGPQYNFPKVLKVSELLARQIVVGRGGRIEKDDSGKEYFVIPVEAPQPNKCVQSWEPAPTSGTLFTKKERKQIVEAPGEKQAL